MKKIVLISCTSVGRYIIHELMNSKKYDNFELVGIINLSEDAAVGKVNYDSYRDLNKIYNISVHYCENINDEEIINYLTGIKPDIIIQSGWSQKFSDKLLEIPVHGCIGQHAAPLPRGRGAACVNWAIINGENEWGNSFFKMEEKYDTGVIYAQKMFNIHIYDNVKTVYDKVAITTVEMLRENLADWMGGYFKGIQQDESIATYYKKRIPEDGLIDFSMSSKEIYNKIRALTHPYPGAFFYHICKGEYKKVFIWEADFFESYPLDNNNNCIDSIGGTLIKCDDGSFLLMKRIQIENEPEVWANEIFQDALLTWENNK